MASNIDEFQPVSGNPTTQSMRDNFAAAKTEILALQTGVSTAQTTATNAQTAANNAHTAANNKASIANDLGGTPGAPTVTRLQGRAVANIAPANGYALVWNQSMARWEPGNTGAAGFLPTTGGKITGDLVIEGTWGHGLDVTLYGSNPRPNTGISNEPIYTTGLHMRMPNGLTSSPFQEGLGFSNNGGFYDHVQNWVADDRTYWQVGAAAGQLCFNCYQSGFGSWYGGTTLTGAFFKLIQAGSTGLYDKNNNHTYMYMGPCVWLEGSAYKTDGGAWSSISDGRVKSNVEPYQAGLPELLQLDPITFCYNGRGGTKETGQTHIGLVAEKVKDVMPEMVGAFRKKLDYDGEVTELLTLNPSALPYAILNALKEINRRLEKLEADDQ